MLRQATSRYKGQSASKCSSILGSTSTFDGTNRGLFLDQYNNAAELNSNLSLDIAERHESQNHYGETAWFAGHRNGQTGLSNPNTQDIKNVSDVC